MSASLARVTRDVALADDAVARAEGDNDAVAQAQPDPIDEVTALLSRGAAAARRVLSGPDGPLALALILAMTATAEATLYTEEIEPALLTNLVATLPLALVRKRLAWATATIVLAVSVALGEQALTISGLLALLIVLYLSASRYRRRWCVLLAFPFFVNAVSPYSGDEPGFANVLLLFVVVAALALGDSRRERGRAIAERDETRRAMQDTLEDQAAMGSAPGSHVTCTTSSRTTSRRSPSRRRRPGSRPSACPGRRARTSRRSPRPPATPSTRCAACSVSCGRTPTATPGASLSPASPSWTS